MNISLTLTNPEIAMQNQEITMRDMAQIYIEYKKEIGEPVNSEKNVHPNLMRDFKKMVGTLDSESLRVIIFEEVKFEYINGKGGVQEAKTITMDLKTSVWFASKFNHNLRAKLVSYAFDKLEEENKELVQSIIDKENRILEDSIEIERLQAIAAEKFRTYGDFKPLSKWKYEFGFTQTTSELMDILDDCGIIRTEEIIQKKRFNIDKKNVKREAGANIVFNRFIIEKHLSYLIPKNPK
jgi:hypothetical protein